MSRRDTKDKFKSGFVSILGRPNVGKSTLLNAFLGKKVSIVSTVPQTTRYQVRGILHLDNAQIVFVDTPGIHSFRKVLASHLNTVAKKCVEGIELILYVVDVSRSVGREEKSIMRFIINSKKKLIMALNKIDISKEFLSQYIETWKTLLRESHSKKDHVIYYIPISAKKGKNLDKLKEAIVESLPYQPPFYEPDCITDFPVKFRVADIIREKLFLNLKEELPHSVAVEVRDIEDKEKIIYIEAIIYVSRASQRKIIIGHKGTMIKEIGTCARQDIEAILGKKVYLQLEVKILKNWEDNPRILKELGYWWA